MPRRLSSFAGTGRYAVRRSVGSGTSGAVYEAYDTVEQRAIALKHLDHLDPAELYRFKREFRSRAGVLHPNLVTMHELVNEGHAWFFTMEYIAGVDFLAYARAGGFERVGVALAGLARGAAALHAAGLVHCDLKPANVLVEDDGRVVIVDFGFVVGRDGDSLHSGVRGTPLYIAPEHVSGARPSPASDCYSIGVMLYEALAGQPPFDGAPLEVLTNKVSRDPRAPSVLVPSVPPALDALCMALLARDPAARPTAGGVVRALEETGVVAVGAESPDPERAALVGRSAELAALQTALDRAREGVATLALVSGESGIGKSRLVQELVARAAGRAAVLHSRCFESESMPYKGVDGLVDALTRHLEALPDGDRDALLAPLTGALALLFPVLRRLEAIARKGLPLALDPLELRRRALGELRALFGRLAERDPLVLVIDDLQWGDVDSADVLIELLRPPNPARLLLVCAYRSEERDTSAALHALLDRGAAPAEHVVDVQLDALSARETEALARALSSAAAGDSDAAARKIAHAARGNPFLVCELARLESAELVGHDADGTRDLADRIVQARLSRLTDASRRLLQYIAAAGQPIPLAVAQRAADVRDEGGAAAALRAQRLIRSRGARATDTVEPAHDRIRHAAVAALSAPAAAYERLAVAVESWGGADPHALAVFWRNAGQSERAARYALRAAQGAAEALAFDRAASAYAIALELGVLDSAHAHAVKVELARALANAGRGAEAARIYLDAAAGASSSATAEELRRLAAEQLLRCGHISEGVALFEDVFRVAGLRFARTPRRALVSLGLLRARLRLRGLGFRERPASEIAPATLARIDTCWAAAPGIGFSDVIRGAELQARGLLMSLRAGEPQRVARALAVEASFRAPGGGNRDRGVAELVARAEELARRLDDPHVVGLCGIARMLEAYCRGQWAHTLELAAPTLELLHERCVGAHWERASAGNLRRWALAWTGRVRELYEDVAAALRQAEDHGDLYTTVDLRTGASILAWLGRDDVDGAAEQVARAMREWSASGYQLQHYSALQAHVAIALYAGRPADALAHLEQHLPVLRRSLFLTVQVTRVELWYMVASAELAAGRDLRAAARAARRVARERMPWTEPIADLLRAAIAARRDRRDEAAERLRAAAAAFDACDMALHAESARLRLAALIGTHADRQHRAAVDQMHALGAARPERIADMLAPGF